MDPKDRSQVAFGDVAVVMGVHLALDDSDADLLAQLLTIRDHRRRFGDQAFAGCAISGFDDDPRELYEIPEVRSFCGRLVDYGFISGLDLTANSELRDAIGLPTDPILARCKMLGALEVWLVACNLVARTVDGQFAATITIHMFREFVDVLRKADKAYVDRLKQ